MCLVPLYIGKSYQDNANYDVAKMDACPLLLSWLWLFDQNVWHQERENSCSFQWKNMKIFLLSLTEKYNSFMNPSKLSTSHNLVVLLGPSFYNELKGCSMTLSIVTMNSPDGCLQPLLKIVQHMLKMFPRV